MGLALALIIVVLGMLLLLIRMAQTVRPYETGLVIVLGSFKGIIGPGFHLTSPLARVVRVDMRSRIESVGPYPIPLADGSPVVVEVRAEYRVVDPAKSVFQTRDLRESIHGDMKDSVARSFSMAAPGTLPSKGWALSEDTRSRLVDRAARVGVEVGQVTVSVRGPLGPVEYLAGERLRGAV